MKERTIVINESGGRVPVVDWEKVFKKTVEVLKKKKLRPVSFIFVNVSRSRELNKKYRKKDKPANVLAFRETREVVLTPEIIKGKEQLVWLAIHGILHLEGYDHVTDKEAEEMEGLEDKIIKKLG